jgi:hypothetical protein
MAVHDQAALGGDLYRAVAEHFDRITLFAGPVVGSPQRVRSAVASPLKRTMDSKASHRPGKAD